MFSRLYHMKHFDVCPNAPLNFRNRAAGQEFAELLFFLQCSTLLVKCAPGVTLKRWFTLLFVIVFLSMSQTVALTCISGNPRHLNKSNKSWVSRWVLFFDRVRCVATPAAPILPKVRCCLALVFFSLAIFYIYTLHFTFPGVFCVHYRKTFLLLHWVIPSGTLKLSLSQRPPPHFPVTTRDLRQWVMTFSAVGSISTLMCD